MANHRPPRKSGWQTRPWGVTLTHRWEVRRASWWLDVPRSCWRERVNQEARGMSRGRYGIQSADDLKRVIE